METVDSARDVRRAGVRDVAALAGVSTQTVSRVINEHPSVRDETRRRVQDAMLQLGYRVNNAARTLGTRRTRTLGVIASNAALFGPSSAVVALEAAARTEGRWVTTAYADASDESSTLTSLEHLLSQGVDGIVVVAPRVSTVSVLRKQDAGLRIAALPSDRGIDDQAEAAGLAVTHLLELGHRRIARLGGPGDWLEEAARVRGFDETMRRTGIDAAARWSGDWSAASGAARAAEVAEVVRSGAATAVVVTNDQMALGLISGLVSAGLSVPRDVSIVGFDDNTDSAFYRPALTTVRVDLEGDARRCVSEVLGLDVQASVKSPRLIARESTAPVG
ncbi:LacI family DNA-binding transcriptional regulator [Humibacter ginsengisoli]